MAADCGRQTSGEKCDPLALAGRNSLEPDERARIPVCQLDLLYLEWETECGRCGGLMKSSCLNLGSPIGLRQLR